MNILIAKLLKPFFKIRQSKIALNQTLTLKLGVTLVLNVTRVYDFVNPAAPLSMAMTKAKINSGVLRPKILNHFGAVKVVHSKSSDKHESSLTLIVALNKSWHRLV